MKANILTGKNQPLIFQETETPGCKAGEVLVHLHASAFNRRDYWIQQGQYAGLKYPVIPGSDGSGVIVKTGEGVNSALEGTSVIINPGFLWGESESAQSPTRFRILGMPDNGTFAEYVSVPVEYTFERPSHLTHLQAAALPLAGVTAYRTLFSRANLTSGEKVLITGIGGGVALFTLQFALAAGAEVWVTSGSEEKIEKAKKLGAKSGVSYRNPEWAKSLLTEAGNFDVIIDSAGGEGFPDLLNLAAFGGRIAIYGGTKGSFAALSPQKIFWKQLSILGSTMGSPEDFRNMTAFVSTHKIIPVIDTELPLSDANEGMNRLAQNTQFGKIILNHTGVL
ncbi:MAG: zinc-binding dehydrogenase [Bacteroidia bacterium]|nr:zinc-binding dehydrogenase [Bacteroidia bacterium]